MPPLNDSSTNQLSIDQLSTDQLSIDQLHALSEEELRELILCCEATFAEGGARADLYELFTCCQQELSRRTWN